MASEVPDGPPARDEQALGELTVAQLLGPLDRSKYDVRPHPDLDSPQVPMLRSGLPLVVPPPVNVKRVQNDPQNIFLRTIYKTLRKQAEAAAASRKRKVPATPGGKITDLIPSAPNSETGASRVKPPMKKGRVAE